MTNYKAKEVIQAADRMRKCIDGIATYEEVITESWGTFITDGNVAGRHPLSVAHELIGMGMVALSVVGEAVRLCYDHGDPELMWWTNWGDEGESSSYATPLAAVVAAVEAVLPLKDQTDD